MRCITVNYTQLRQIGSMFCVFKLNTYIILIINLLYISTTNREYVLNASKLNVKLDF